MTDTITGAVEAMGAGPLEEDRLRTHVFGLFSRVLDAESGIYLANHSLGRPLDRTAEDIAGAVGRWYAEMDGAWESWLGEMSSFRANIARLIGAGRGNSIVPKISAGQGLRAVLNALPSPRPRVVSTTGEFDSIDFILKSYVHKGRAEVSWVGPDSEGLFHADAIGRALEDGADLLVVSKVVFATGQEIEGLEELVARAHARGTLVLVDLYHAGGAMPIGFDGLGADFGIGGSYKYTRGGPGACWLAVAGRHLVPEGTPDPGGLFTLDTGWFAKRDSFGFARTPEPERSGGGDAWLESTPSFLLPYQAKAGLELTLAIGVDRLRAYNLVQQGRLIDALRAHGVEPRLVEPRGAFVLIAHPEAKAVSAALGLAGVRTDARPCPSGRGAHVRLCPDILTTADEIDRAAAIVGRVVREVSAPSRS